MSGKDDRIVTAEPLLGLVKKDWSEFLHAPVSEDEINDMRRHERTGRPLCETSFIDQLEILLNRPLKPKKPGRKPKKKQ